MTSLFKSKAPPAPVIMAPPAPPPVAPMPDPDDAQAIAKRKQAAAKQKGGRASTILDEGETLG